MYIYVITSLFGLSVTCCYVRLCNSRQVERNSDYGSFGTFAGGWNLKVGMEGLLREVARRDGRASYVGCSACRAMFIFRFARGQRLPESNRVLELHASWLQGCRIVSVQTGSECAAKPGQLALLHALAQSAGKQLFTFGRCLYDSINREERRA